MSPTSGASGSQVTITGEQFGSLQGKSTIKFGEAPANIRYWSKTYIIVYVPDAAPGSLDVVLTIDEVKEEHLGSFTIQGASQSSSVPVSAVSSANNTATTQSPHVKDKLKEQASAPPAQPAPPAPAPAPSPQTPASLAPAAQPPEQPKAPTTTALVILAITPPSGVAGTTITITGSGFGDKQGDSMVTIGGQPVTISKDNWTNIKIVMTAPDLSQLDDFDRTYGYDAPVSVSIVDTKNKTTEKVTTTFTETPPRWSDMDEKPLDIKFVGGYEQGFQSAQSSTSDAFLAVYGRALFLKNTFGPFYSIRLQTAPQASGTYGVVSLLSNPSGAVTTQSLQTVGSAVDLSLGLEYQIPPWSHQKQSSLGVIAGGGFVTPLQVNSVSASYVMPAFGTVECSELQSRLSGVLSNPVFAGIKANTAPTSTSCYSNTTTSTPTAVSTLVYAAPNQPNYYPKYFIGLRIVNRFAGASGLKQCDEHNPCERGFVDFTLGQNASVSGGSLKHLIAGVDSIYPLPVPGLNFIYLFGSTSVRLYNLPPGQSPLILTASPTSGSSTPPASPNPTVLVLPLTQPDRDFYRIGAGINLNDIFKALKPKAATSP
jgi:hypothetical protein